MYWDIVEVKPEADYRLFVRFKDGLSGHVQLRRETLTGSLAPLRDADFFEQVFIDEGAVAWPGEIDLAPDAMYSEVILRSQLSRFYELYDLLEDPSDRDAYNFQPHLRNPLAFEVYALWEKELQKLENYAWECLRSKAARYLKREVKKGRDWQQLFDALGEALAYNYLKESVGCSRVCFIPESDKPAPDLEGVVDGVRVLCEVKTINVSDDEIAAREAPVVRRRAGLLEDGFLCKLDSDISKAKTQLQSYNIDGEAQHLVYINICFDGSVGALPGHYAEEYLQQIVEHLRNRPPGVKVVTSAGLSEKWMRVVTL